MIYDVVILILFHNLHFPFDNFHQTKQKMKWITGALQPPRARVNGIVYLLYFLVAIFAQVLTSQKYVTAGNAVNMVAFALYFALALLFYYLFKPVNRYISLIAACVSITGCIIGAIAVYYLPASKINALIFFAPYCLMIGYLIFRSTFLPHILGMLMLLAGVGWLVYMSPLEKYLETYIKAIGILAEAALMLWLVIMGVNVRQWKEQAGAGSSMGEVQ